MSRKGENIFKRKDGRWEARVIHHYENGKAKYQYIYGTSYTEVKAKKQKILSLPDRAKLPSTDQKTTFQTLANLWLADTKILVKESTYTRYYRMVEKYLFPLMKNQELNKMDPSFIKQLPEKLLCEGGIHNKGLSPKTVSDILCVLKQIFKYGKENQYSCPDISTIKYPQKMTKHIQIWNTTERIKMEEQLLNAEDTTSLGILFTLFTGVRIGELCGLRWEDIDLENATVTINRTVERIADLNPETKNKTKVVITEPKTETSKRIIPLPAFLVEYLSKRKCGMDCYLLTGCQKNTEPHQYYIRYKKFLEQNQLTIHSFHSLRHTFATRCVELGFDTKSLSEILGHSSITTTLAVYVHPSLHQKKLQMDRHLPMA